ncbi:MULTISPECIES: hypothetical protein [unclassified Butyrivibrio]|uniref:hypothetical protein n=1 Tax=unclassified Butyrivibrio TaxID=2639466 RepID=UPI0008F2A4B8|nr:MULTISPECIES: hypothetical protein [unclassified Butyrivibrio]RKM56089.1 hypothetical protein D6856_14920 [Butyrivibrio sp. XB500-5]SFU94802.1 hypothetical protein SAMN02910342_02556 [Butyrivibrio sp. INlla21]
MMDYNFLSSVDRITSTYLNNDPLSKASDLGDDIKAKLGPEFTEVYDSLKAIKMLNSTVHQDNSISQKDSLREHASRLGYSIDNRVIDMLRISISDEMNIKVNDAVQSAANALF